MNTITYLSRICMSLTVMLWLGTAVCQAQFYSNRSNEQDYQQQNAFHSTSTMTTVHSEYSSLITPVGATAPVSESDYESGSNNSDGYMPTGPRRVSENGDIGDPGTPIGEGLYFLLFCAVGYIAVHIVKSRKLTTNHE